MKRCILRFFTGSAVDKIQSVFIKYVLPNWVFLALGFLFMVLFAMLEAASVKILEPVFNEVFIDRNKGILAFLALQILGLFALKGVANYLQSIFMARVGINMVRMMQNDLYYKLIRQDIAFFSRHNSSGLLMHFMGDMGAIRDAVLNGFTSLVKDGFTVIFMVALMFWKSFEMAAVTFILFPIGIYPVVWIGRKVKRFFATEQLLGGNLFALIAQSFQGIRIIKSYQLEERECARVEVSSQSMADLSFKLAKMSSLSTPLMEFLSGFAVAATLVYGGWRITQGTLSTGAFMVFLLAVVAAYKPMKNLARLNMRVQMGVAAIDRVESAMNSLIAIEDRPDAQPLQLTKGEVHFNDLTFEYVPNHPVLKDVSLRVEAGKVAAIVGLAGSGKSTLINLLQRYYDPQCGSITIDGQDTRFVTLDSLRSNIGFVSQDVVIFEGSIAENILMGKPGASEEELMAASQGCGAHDFIIRQAQGYQTQVGERGGNLSGGQKQLVSIARAMLKNAPILLLDEPTSSLDSRSESMVQEGLRTLMQGRTTLIIAHRLSTIRDADVIYAMDEGRVVESGSHNELLAHNGLYARLYRLQHGVGTGEGLGPGYEERVVQ